MITIREIAQAAGVSTATVSNVIHGKTKKVSKENIEKIEKLLKESGYVSRGDRHALHEKSPCLIGVVVHTTKSYENTFLSDPFYGHLVGVLEEEIRRSGYYMMLYASDDIEEIYQMVLMWNISGLIAITFTHTEYEKLAALVQKPVVAVDLYKKTGRDCYNIGTQDEQGGYRMTRYLLDCGYTDILVAGNRSVGVDFVRWQGYKTALEQDHRHLKVYPITVLSDIQDKRTGQLAELLRHIKKSNDTALFFLADSLAVEGISYFIQHGISIPEDVGIAGYDDTSYAGNYYPKITTVNQNITEKAENAVQMLIKLLRGEEPGERELLLPVRLVVRDSTKKRQ